jgi:hypothetical protein
MSYEEEDTCHMRRSVVESFQPPGPPDPQQRKHLVYEEEDAYMSYEEDACMSHEEEDA